MPLYTPSRVAAVVLSLALAVSQVTSQAAYEDFTLTYGRVCLKPGYLHEIAGVNGNERLCAIACLDRGVDCRAFRLVGPAGTCQTMEFNRCSHMPNRDPCSDFGWIYLRHQPGLPRGQLCRGGYGSSYFGSTYKFYNNASYTLGLAQCNSEPGQLTKMADALDHAEMLYMHWLKTNVNAGQPYFAGGYRTGTFYTGTWYWQACGLELLPEVWRPGQPNGGDDYNVIDFWSGHTDTVDDCTNSWPGIDQSLCECVNPFM